MVLSSFKTLPELAEAPYALPRSFGATNYVRAWQEARTSVTLTNSIVVTALSLMLNTVLASLAAYGIARFTFRWRAAVRLLFLSGPIPEAIRRRLRARDAANAGAKGIETKP